MKKIFNKIISVITTILILLGIFLIIFSWTTTTFGSNMDYFTFIIGILLIIIGLIILLLSIKNKIVRVFAVVTIFFTIIFSVLILYIPDSTPPLIQCPTISIDVESTDPANHSIDFVIASIHPNQEYNIDEFEFKLKNSLGNFTEFEIDFKPDKIAVGTNFTIKINQSDNYELIIIYSKTQSLVCSPKEYYI